MLTNHDLHVTQMLRELQVTGYGSSFDLFLAAIAAIARRTLRETAKLGIRFLESELKAAGK